MCARRSWKFGCTFVVNISRHAVFRSGHAFGISCFRNSLPTITFEDPLTCAFSLLSVHVRLLRKELMGARRSWKFVCTFVVISSRHDVIRS